MFYIKIKILSDFLKKFERRNCYQETFNVNALKKYYILFK